MFLNQGRLFLNCSYFICFCKEGVTGAQHAHMVAFKEVLSTWRTWPQRPTLERSCPTNTLRSKESNVFLGIGLLFFGPTWQSTFHDRSLKDILGELRPVVILICHCDYNLHWVLNSIPIWRHSMRKELQQSREGYLGPKEEEAGERSGLTRAEGPSPG